MSNQQRLHALDTEVPLAELVGAIKRYGKTVALDGVNLEVRRGEVLAVLGPNGAGKSTAISLWLGLLQRDDGEARLMGRSPLDVESRRDVGVMMQEVALEFLDEPTVGLDVQARETMWRAIRDLVARGSSVVLTTHYLDEAEALANRVVVLAKGRVIASGSVDEIRSVVSRTHISCASALSADDVRRWPSVFEATSDDRKLTITAADGESVVRRLLAADHELRHLEVRPAALSEAFTELTKEAA